MRYHFHTCDVFTDSVFGGNPLAVFADGRGLDARQMQLVAREFNLSETVFVLPPDDAAHTRRLRIFTPARELPFAGHPTVGTAHVLAAIGEVALGAATTRIIFEEGVGPVPVTIRAEGGAPVFAQLTAAQPPEVGPPPPTDDIIAAALGLEPGDLGAGGMTPSAVSCGTPFLLVPVREPAVLGRIAVDTGRWRAAFADYVSSALFVFALGGERPGSDISARMFSPLWGIPEDPATGAAATALGGYLAMRDERADAAFSWIVEQGFAMGRPSIIEVEADRRGGQVAEIRVGGASVMVSEGDFDIPDARALGQP
jgi:trans-2,3-dihydro-3-hydroxyanthranilate isomerase